MTLDEFIAGEKTNYYLNTFGDTIRSTETWNHAELFQNCREEQTSNGYAYITDNWNLPIEFYKPDVVVEVNSGTMFNASKTINKDATAAQISIDSKIFTDKYGKVGKNNFFYVEASSVTANPVMQIELKPNTDDAYMPNADVMSGKYDIQAVFVPMWYYDVVEKGADEYLKIDGDTIVIDEEKIDSAKNKNILKLACKIYYNSEKCSNTKPVDNYTVKQADTEGINLNEYYVTKVDTVTLIKDFEFPCTYKNIRSRGSNQKKSYPILEIKPNANNSYTSKGYSNSFCIDRIILRSKETGQTTTIIP